MSSRKTKILIGLDHDPIIGYHLRDPYVDAFLKQSVELVPLFYERDLAKDLLDQVDGFVMPGGLQDLDPTSFKASEVHPKTCINTKRTDFDFFVLEEALKREIPIFGICWGFQLINVYLGGTLYQHIPDELGKEVQHETPKGEPDAMHKVYFEKDSQARRDFGVDELLVNSTHHQGVKQLANELVCEAKSADGLVECFRHSTREYLWGVEWHPERLDEDPFIPAFVKACQRSS